MVSPSHPPPRLRHQGNQRRSHGRLLQRIASRRRGPQGMRVPERASVPRLRNRLLGRRPPPGPGWARGRQGRRRIRFDPPGRLPDAHRPGVRRGPRSSDRVGVPSEGRVEILLAPRPVSRARCGTAAPTVWSGHRCALNATTTSAPSCRTPARPSCGDEPPSTSNVSSPMSSGALRPTWRVRFASPTDVGDVAHERPRCSSHQNYWLRLQRHPVIASTRRNRSLRLDTGPESRNPGPSRIRAPPER